MREGERRMARKSVRWGRLLGVLSVRGWEAGGGTAASSASSPTGMEEEEVKRGFSGKPPEVSKIFTFRSFSIENGEENKILRAFP